MATLRHPGEKEDKKRKERKNDQKRVHWHA
jgi:hypothetical protein